MKILGTGLSGLVGSRVVELLKPQYEFENIGHETGIDIADREGVIQAINDSDAPILLHFAAKTDVDGCEKDKVLKKDGEAWKINVLGTENVIEGCRQGKKKIIHISTDFVFDGEKKPQEAYEETDTPNPINWYGQTKYEAEKLVQSSDLDWAVVRIVYPYRAFFKRMDFVRSIIYKFQNKENICAITDHVMTPTFVDDIAFALNQFIDKNAEGIYHVVGSQYITPYDAAKLIAQEFGLDNRLIKKITRKEYFLRKALRPFNLALKNDKIQRLGVKMRTFEEGLKEVKSQTKKLQS
ncbi:MAG: SDR family oxidoreductase [bacterium]|nr:SDR family oxidoreductase [bacterium]